MSSRVDTTDPRREGLLFDLFGTLVFFDVARLPRIRIGETERPATIAQAEDVLARLSPQPELEQLYAALRQVSVAFEEEAGRSHRERSSRERFVEALKLLAVSGDLQAVAEELSLRHMNGLIAAVVCPADRRELLASLGRRYRIALVSNFDHGATARSLLRREGLIEFLDAIVVSEEIGLRKPHPQVFQSACERIGLDPSVCLHVGDSHRADVCGATEAGLRALWVDATDVPIAPALDRISDVSELVAWLDARPSVV